jgi:hypothetical protein
MLMPGAHSRGPGDDGESIPIWVNIFWKYFEMKKKTIILKSAQHEQFQVVLQTMRNTLLAPKDALDSATSTSSQTLDNAIVRSATTHPTSKSLVAPDGGITLVPAEVCNSKTVHQTAFTPRNVWQRVANFRSSEAGSWWYRYKRRRFTRDDGDDEQPHSSNVEASIL